MGFYIRQGNDCWAAGGHILAKASFSNDGLALHAEGIVLDKVETLGLPLNLNEIEERPYLSPEKAKLRATCEAFLQYWAIYSQIRGQDLEEQDLFERTVFGGSWAAAGEFEPKYRLQLFFSLCQHLLPDAVFTAPERSFVVEVENEKNRENMGSVASLRMHGYRMVFGSTKKLTGLAPWSTQAGDLICVLLGCSFPVVLRPVQDYYVLVGEVYVDHFMQGEAVKDPSYTLRTFEIR